MVDLAVVLNNDTNLVAPVEKSKLERRGMILVAKQVVKRLAVTLLRDEKCSNLDSKKLVGILPCVFHSLQQCVLDLMLPYSLINQNNSLNFRFETRNAAIWTARSWSEYCHVLFTECSNAFLI